MKEMWNTINNILGQGKQQSSQNKLKNEHGNDFDFTTLVAYQTNSIFFFVYVGPELASNIQVMGKKYFNYLCDLRSSSMYMNPIVERDILKT